MKTKKTFISIESDWKKLKIICIEKNLSVSKLIRILIKRYIRFYEKKERGNVLQEDSRENNEINN